jgi:Helix-turn-helix domain
MSIQAVAWALSLNIPDPFAKLVLVSLSNHADNETGHCWPTQSLIAKEASCNRRTVMRKVPYLLEAGYIQVIIIAAKAAHWITKYSFPGESP